MKRIFSLITALSVLLLTGCKKGDTAGDFATHTVGTYLKRVAVGNGIIDFGNIAGSKVDVTVSAFGTPAAKIKIFASVGSATTNTAVWKAIKEVTYSGDTKLEVTGTELQNAVGPLVTGQSYTFYNQVHSTDGQVHDITNMNSSMYGSPNYNPLMTWTAVVVCPYVPTQFGTVGSTINMEVLQDDWADYSPGALVQMTIGPAANQLNFPRMWLTLPFFNTAVNITQATGAATVARTIYGDYPQYGIFGISHASSGTNNWVFSCQQTVTLTLNHAVGTTNYGTYLFRLKKP